jgi:hypothetical protein
VVIEAELSEHDVTEIPGPFAVGDDDGGGGKE